MKIIIRICTITGSFTFQVNPEGTEDYSFTAFNLEFTQYNGRLDYPDIAIPTLSSYHTFKTSNDKYVNTLVKVQKVFKRIYDKTPPNDIAQMTQAICKAFKVTEYQINVNSGFYYDNAKPYDISAIVDIVKNLESFDIPTMF